ncbi:ferredoxin [Nocardia fluminea]|uniref:ferredoxin n=1 Tax=Nocardia fluminea TaxID=134984 RepID=UPI0034106698
MRVAVDSDRCRGHGICLTLRPDIFTLTDDGYAEPRHGAVSADDESDVRTAIDACPEGAISFER